MVITSRVQLKNLRAARPNLNVVITGGTRGLGRALSKEFARQGDNVYILSRSQNDIDDLCEQIPNIIGKSCDISDRKQLGAHIEHIVDELGSIDLWVNNAGLSGGSRDFIELDDETIETIITTNVLGTSVSCRLLYDIMNGQDTGGAIFNLAGAGSDGAPTPKFAAYGATKAAIVQMSKSLQQEWASTPVDLHIVSPGMMFTELLTENIDEDLFNIIQFVCSEPEVVAHNLVPRIRNAYYYKDKSYIRFLTVLKIARKFFTSKMIKM